MKEQISILGSGWLGLPLAKRLQELGNKIKISTTSDNKVVALKKQGLDAYGIELFEESLSGDVTSFLEGSSTLVLNIPPGLRSDPESSFVQKIKNFLHYLERSSVNKVLFISSTSVFKNNTSFPFITEETKPNAEGETGKQLIAIEQLLHKNTNFETTVLRFGGLYDERRHPAQFIAKNGVFDNPEAPVNLIHREDCLGIIAAIIKSNNWNISINAACPEHPTKRVYYPQVCKKMELPIPIPNSSKPSMGKIIKSSFVENTLGYSFKVKL